VTVNVVDSSVVVSVIAVETTERMVTHFSVDTTLRIVGVRSTVPVVRTGKVVVPVDVDLVGTTRVLLRSRGQRGHSPPLGRHNLQSSKSKKDCSCLKNRKGGSACRRRLGRDYESAIPIETTKTTVTTFSVDTIFRIVRVRRTIPVLATGKVVVPVNVDSVGTTRARFRSRGRTPRSLPSLSTQSSK
jgi:hypothetical protein